MSSSNLQRGEGAADLSPAVGVAVRGGRRVGCAWVPAERQRAFPRPRRAARRRGRRCGGGFPVPAVETKGADSCDAPVHLQCDSPADSALSRFFFVFGLDAAEAAADPGAGAPRAARRAAAAVRVGGRELPRGRRRELPGGGPLGEMRLRVLAFSLLSGKRSGQRKGTALPFRSRAFRGQLRPAMRAECGTMAARAPRLAQAASRRLGTRVPCLLRSTGARLDLTFQVVD